MAITFPRTTLLDVAMSDQSFRLVSRQEMSRLASGRVIGKDLGPAIWIAEYSTAPLANDDAVAYEALLDSLDGVISTFEAFDMRRQYPKQYPDGTGANNGTLATVPNAYSLSLSGLVAGQVISAGDYLSFDYGGSRALHRAAEAITANGSGVTAAFEVRPHIRTGYILSPATTVKLKVPRGLFNLVPGSVSVRPAGPVNTIISFQAVQSLE